MRSGSICNGSRGPSHGEPTVHSLVAVTAAGSSGAVHSETGATC